jgi:hypothetical protein
VIEKILQENYKVQFVSSADLTTYTGQFIPASGELKFEEFEELFYQLIQNPKVKREGRGRESGGGDGTKRGSIYSGFPGY